MAPSTYGTETKPKRKIKGLPLAIVLLIGIIILGIGFFAGSSPVLYTGLVIVALSVIAGIIMFVSGSQSEGSDTV